MDAWFQYALGVGEVIYDMKLHEYEDACASLLLTAAKVAATAEAATDDANKARRSGKGVHCEHSGLDTTVAPAPAWAAHLQPPALTSSSAGSPLISMCETVSDVPMTSSTTAGSVPSRGAAATPGSRPVADPCTVSGATTALNESCLIHNGSIDHSKTPTLSSSATYLPATSGDCNRCALTLTAGAAASPTEAFGALVEATQLRKPMRAATLSSQHIDAIQAEADFVFQELDDVFTLQPGDAAAAAAASTAGVAPRPSPTLPSSTDTRCEPAEDEEECGVAAAQSRPLPAPPPASVADSSERHLLYGELTSVGVRQLQAISMASSCVVREENGRSSSRDDGVGGAGLLANSSTTMACSCGSSSEPAFGSTPPVNHTVSAPLSCTGDHSHGHGHTSRGAVVVAVDVGSGNGRLLFEWGRLAAAACRRQHTSSPPGHADEGATLVDAAPTAVTLHSTTSASGGTTVATTHAASMHCGNLVAAAYAPLGIASPAAVWRGWLGVGIELVPSRMRIARKALVPHYLNLKQALVAPSAGGGVSAPVTHLDPCPLEATVAADMAASCSPSASLQSGVATHSTAVRSVVGSPVWTGTSVSMTPGCRVQQPSARVLLYEGDALAPGVLSNATLCRFANPNHHGEPLPLGESYAAHDDGGDVQGWGADSSSFRCTATSTASVSTTAAVMNETGLLESIGSDAHGLGGARTPANMSLASIATVGSSCSACPRLVGQNYYPLCSIEGGPLLTGREEPHLVVFCCGLGFDEAEVRRLCQRLEDMLLRRSATAAETAPSSVGGGPMTYQQLSKDANSFPSHYVRHHHSRMSHSEDAETETSPVDCASPSLTYSEKSKEENIKTGVGIQPMAPTAAVPITGIATGIGAGFASHRHWESVTCVLLLRPMDVLLPTFPLFRYARRVYDTVRQPILAEDTALLLSTGRRSDGSSVPFSVRATPAPEGSPGLSAAGGIAESDVWRTTLETTWMNAAPAWVVRFHF